MIAINSKPFLYYKDVCRLLLFILYASSFWFRMLSPFGLLNESFPAVLPFEENLRCSETKRLRFSSKPSGRGMDGG